MQSPTRGSLTAVSFIELLKDAAESKLTGMLRVEPGTFVKVVYFLEGTIAFASSNEKSDRLTEVLRLAGKLTPEQVEDAQARLKPNVSLGKTLVELGYLSPRDLLWGAKAQVEGIIHHLLFLAEGNYQILEGSLPKEIIKLNLGVPQVIFEGLMKCQDRRWILQHIESPEAIYTLSQDFHEKYSRYGLSADTVVSRLDGKRTLDGIAHLAGIDTFEVCKIAVALQLLGLAKRAPLQMDLEEPKPPIEVESEARDEALTELSDLAVPPNEDVSLGEVMQIPAVEDLHKEPVEATRSEELQPALFPEKMNEPISVQEHVEPPLVESANPVEPVEKIEPETVDREPPRILFSGGFPAEDEEIVQDVRSRWLSWRTTALFALLVLAAASAAYHWLAGKPQNIQPQVKTAVQPAATIPVEQTSTEPEVESANIKGVVGIETDGNTNAKISDDTAVAEPDASAALTLLQSGRTRQAAFAWKQEIANEKSKFTIQLMIACQEKTVLEAMQTVPDVRRFLILPLHYQGQSCYRILYGLYGTEQEAQSATRSLPQVFLQQASPAQAVSVRKIWK